MQRDDQHQGYLVGAPKRFDAELVAAFAFALGVAQTISDVRSQRGAPGSN